VAPPGIIQTPKINAFRGGGDHEGGGNAFSFNYTVLENVFRRWLFAIHSVYKCNFRRWLLLSCIN
jgi:hypothetical protein